MARNICLICKKVVTCNRTSHLKKEHNIDASFKGAVKQYFTTPEEAGIQEVKKL